MQQISMPSQVLGTIQQLKVHHKTTVWQWFCNAFSMFWAFILSQRLVLATVVSLVIFMSPPFTSLVQSPVANAAKTTTNSIITRSDAETVYLRAVNQLRLAHGRAPLVIDSRLTTSAWQKSNDMVLQNYWGHYAPNGTSFSDYIWRSSPKAEEVGENLARCFDNRQDAFDALVASPTHYAIMMGTYTNFGVAEVQDPKSGCLYTTMHFAMYQ